MTADKPIALEDRETRGDARLFSPSAARNGGPIADVLARFLAKNAKVLEIGSGTGEHAVAFVTARPDLTWFPSELDPASRASVAAWTAHAALAQIRPPSVIDASAETWGVEDEAPFDAVVSINMIHIAPWAAGRGLIAGAGRLLRSGGILFLYGAYSRGGAHTSPSNAEFDASLKSRDPDWGVRDLDDVEAEARARGLELRDVVEMPANNLSVVFEKA